MTPRGDARGARALGIPGILARPMDLFWATPPLHALILVIVAISGWWGFTAYYGSQFARTPAYTWPFVPDSPLFTVLFLPASLFLKLHRKGEKGLLRDIPTWANAFAAFVAAGLIRVGAWTVFALLFYFQTFFGQGGAEAWLRGMLLATHAGMIVLGVMLVAHMRPLTRGGYAAVLLVLLAGDLMDYLWVPLFLAGSGITIYPNGIPSDPMRLRVLATVTVAMSFGAVALIRGLRGTRKPPNP